MLTQHKSNVSTLLKMLGKRSNQLKSNYRLKPNKRGRYGHTQPTLTSGKHVVKQGRTDYAMSLIDPFKRIDCRIPDMACYETVTFTNEVHQLMEITSVNQTGSTNNCVAVISLIPGGGIQFFQGDQAAGAGNISTSANAKIVPGSTHTTTRYKAARLVSAGVKVTFAGDNTQTRGEIIGAFIPADYKVKYSDGAIAVSGTGLTNGLPNTTNYDLRSATAIKSLTANYCEGPLKAGMVVRYKPQDIMSFDMVGVYPTGTEQVEPFGTIVIFMAASLATSLQFDVVLNYEGLVRNNDLGLASAVSSADPGALAHGINAAGKANSCFASTTASIHANIDRVLMSVV